MYEEAIDVLRLVVRAWEKTGVDPMVYYYLGYYYRLKDCRLKDDFWEEADACLRTAAQVSPDYCFPFRLESIEVLRSAMVRQSARRPRAVLPGQPAI